MSASRKKIAAKKVTGKKVVFKVPSKKGDEKSKIAAANTEKGKQSKKINFRSIDIPIADLLLDPNNYRFLDNPNFKKKIKTKFHDAGVQDATLRLLAKDKRYHLSELKKSIIANGYVPMERIIVVVYSSNPKKYLVVEGNRRVAALKSILLENEEGVIDIPAEDLPSLSTIPCALLEAPDNNLRHAERVIMGIRHIAGPKEWGAYQQAQLVTELHDDEGETFSSIGEHLGISAVEVARRYRAMRALKSMENDELYSESSSPEFYRLFHELVSLPDVRKRFGWDDQNNSFVALESAREFFELIAPQESDEPKLTTYSDVRKLKLVVNRPKAEAALLDPDRSLTDALRLAGAEIEDESSDKLSVGQLCAEMRSRIQRIRATEFEKIGEDDFKKIKQLLEAVSSLKRTAEKHVK